MASFVPPKGAIRSARTVTAAARPPSTNAYSPSALRFYRDFRSRGGAYSPQAQQFYRAIGQRRGGGVGALGDAYSPDALRFYQQMATKSPPLGLPSAAETGFAQQRQAANEAYRQGLTANDYQRSGTAQDFTARLRDLVTRFGKQREQMPDPFLRRGVFGSGLWRQGLQEFEQQQLRSRGDLSIQRAQQLGAFDLVRQQIESQRAQALAQIEAQRQALMAQLGVGTIQ